MNSIRKLEILSEAGKYDRCSMNSCTGDLNKKLPNLGGVFHAVLPSGKCIPLLKTLYSNECKNDCYYCNNSAACTKGRKTEFEEHELVNVFTHMLAQRQVEGLFLSSGLSGDEEKTMEKMLNVVRALRMKHFFSGYIHLKVLPGASKSQVDEATRLADRVSINLEAPKKNYLNELTGTKDFKIDLMRRMRWIKQKGRENMTPSGHTTQVIVGGTDETDKDILKFYSKLYSEFDLRRGYFSAFSPVQGTKLEGREAAPLRRQNFLYKTDFLMRDYKVKCKEILFDENGFLDLSVEPKLNMALHSDLFPLDLNNANFEEILLVPGIGPKSAKRVWEKIEEGHKFRSLGELKEFGIRGRQFQHFIALEGSAQKFLTDFS